MQRICINRQAGYLLSGMFSTFLMLGCAFGIGHWAYNDRIDYNKKVEINDPEIESISSIALGPYLRAEQKTLHFANGSLILSEYSRFNSDEELVLKDFVDESYSPWPESRSGLNLCSEQKCIKVMKATVVIDD